MSGTAAPWSFARMARMTFDALDLPDVSDLSVAILGGTGDQGRGLAYRFARAGHAVLIGSRTPERGRAAADDIRTLLGDRAGAGEVTGGDNAWAAAAADVVIIAVPWAGHADTVAALAGPLAGMRGVYAGRLRNAGQVEALTANLIAINRRYRAHVGLRITDL